MRGDDRSAPLKWALARPTLLAFLAYILLGVVFLWPGLLPGHTVSAADYLWNAAPWNTAVPSGLAVAGHHPLTYGANGQLIDTITIFEPLSQYTASQLPHIPLWDPYIMGGMPLLADMQSAIFSPFNLPAYILPFWWSLGVTVLIKIVVAAMGAYLFGRVLKMGLAGAFLCGLIFGFGLFMIAWIPWPLTAVFPFIPWTLLATEWLIRRPGPVAASALAVLVALQFFGGHPESSVFLVFAAAGYFVLRVMQVPGGGVAAMRAAAGEGRSRAAALFEATRRPVVAFALALAVGTALAGVALLPFLELLKHSSDLTERPRSQVHVQANYVFAAFLPKYFPGSFVIVTGFYAGALSLMLAVIALFRRQLPRVIIAVVGALSLAVTLGIQPFFAVAGHIPGLDITYLSRLTIIYLFCMALLAGWGLDDVLRGRVRGGRALAGGLVAVGVFVIPVLIVIATGGASTRFLGRAADIAFRFAAEPGLGAQHFTSIFRMTALLVWMAVAGVAAVLICLVLGHKLPPAVFAVLAIALVVGDLFQAGMGYNPAIPQSQAVQPITPAIRYLQHQVPARFVGVTLFDGIDPLPPDVNIRYGLYDLRGYDLPVITQFGNVWTRYIAPPTDLLPLDTPQVPLSLSNDLSPDALRVLALFGVRDVLEDKLGPTLTIPGLHLVYNGYDAKIYTDVDALPRTWLVTGQDVVSGDNQALAGIVAPGFDPRAAVITEQRLPGLSDRPPGGGAVGQAHIVSYQAQQVTIAAHAERPSELVLSDTYYPGWQVTVNGRPARISRVDYLLRGVAVPAGTDRIVFTYQPSSFRRGLILSLGAALVIVVALAIGFRRRKNRGTPVVASGR
jgi:hypothetical protein